MAIIATAGEGKPFVPAPAGLHQAVCVDVVDLGLLKVAFGGETKQKHMARVVWQIETISGERLIAQKRYTLSLHEKATLRKDLESWRGRPFTDEELRGFDLEKLLSANCQINIQHVTRNGETYANVISIVPLGRGMLKLEPKDYTRVKDRDPNGQQQPGDGPLTEDDIPF